MRTTAGGKSETSPAENIDAILRVEKQDKEALAVHHRFFHWIGWFVGTIQFVALQCAFVLCWIAFNLNFTHQPFVSLAGDDSRPGGRSPYFLRADPPEHH